jgi:hypothetical protein
MNASRSLTSTSKRLLNRTKGSWPAESKRRTLAVDTPSSSATCWSDGRRRAFGASFDRSGSRMEFMRRRFVSRASTRCARWCSVRGVHQGWVRFFNMNLSLIHWFTLIKGVNHEPEFLIRSTHNLVFGKESESWSELIWWVIACLNHRGPVSQSSGRRLVGSAGSVWHPQSGAWPSLC